MSLVNEIKDDREEIMNEKRNRRETEASGEEPSVYFVKLNTDYPIIPSRIEEAGAIILHSLVLLLSHLITALSLPPIRRTNRLHGPRLLHPEPLSEQSTVPRLPGPSASHPAEPHVPASRPLFLRPRQNACRPGQYPHHPRGKPIQLQVR